MSNGPDGTRSAPWNPRDWANRLGFLWILTTPALVVAAVVTSGVFPVIDPWLQILLPGTIGAHFLAIVVLAILPVRAGDAAVGPAAVAARRENRRRSVVLSLMLGAVALQVATSLVPFAWRTVFAVAASAAWTAMFVGFLITYIVLPLRDAHREGTLGSMWRAFHPASFRQHAFADFGSARWTQSSAQAAPAVGPEAEARALRAQLRQNLAAMAPVRAVGRMLVWVIPITTWIGAIFACCAGFVAAADAAVATLGIVLLVGISGWVRFLSPARQAAKAMEKLAARVGGTYTHDGSTRLLSWLDAYWPTYRDEHGTTLYLLGSGLDATMTFDAFGCAVLVRVRSVIWVKHFAPLRAIEVFIGAAHQGVDTAPVVATRCDGWTITTLPGAAHLVRTDVNRSWLEYERIGPLMTMACQAARSPGVFGR